MARKDETLLKAVQTLQTSRGWTYIKEVMEREIVSAAMGMANNASMPVEEMHFRRGSIWAAKQLLDLPQKLEIHLETQVRLDANSMGDATASPSILTKSPPRLGEE